MPRRYVLKRTSCNTYSLQWRHNGRDGVSNHQPQRYLLNRLFGRRSKKTSKLRVTGLCAGNSPGTGEFPSQMASNAENVSIWWRHHVAVVSWTWLLITDGLSRYGISLKCLLPKSSAFECNNVTRFKCFALSLSFHEYNRWGMQVHLDLRKWLNFD